MKSVLKHFRSEGKSTAAARHITGGLSYKFINLKAIRWLGEAPAEMEPDLVSDLASGLTGILGKLWNTLRFPRLLKGSIFLKPELWALLTLLLLPFMPTIVMLMLCAVTLFSVMLCAVSERAEAPNIRKNTGIPGLRYAGLLAVVYLISIAASVDVKESLYPGVLTAFFMLFAFGSFHGFRRWSSLRRAFAAIAAGAVLVALFGIWQWMNPAKYSSGWLDEDMFSEISFRVYSTFQNPNVLGEYFLLVIPFTAALAITAANVRKKVLWWIAAGVMLICAALTYSRGCYIGLALAAVVFLVLLDRRFLIPIAILAVLSPLYLPESIIQRVLSIGSTADTSTNFRVEIWMGVADMLRHFWYSGVGPGEGAFNTVYPLYALEAVEAPHSHCLYLQLICDTGISGLLVFLVLVISLMRSLLSTVRHAKRRQTQVFAAAGTAAMCGFLLQSATDFSFYNYRVLLMFFGVLGLCLLLRQEERLYAADGDAGELALALAEETRPVVLQILSDSNLGGAGRYLINLFTAFDRNKYAMVLVLPRSGVLAQEARAQDIPVVEEDIPGESSLNLQAISELRRTCMLLNPTIVQTHGSLSGRIAARASGAKIVYTRHSVFPIADRLKKGPVHTLSAIVNHVFGDAALAVSPAAEENLREIGVKQGRITTVMNGVRRPEVDAAATERFCTEFGLDRGVFTAGIFARLEAYKGHDSILDAAAMLKAEGRKLQVVICGAGPQEEHICARIQAEGLADTVKFCGYQSHPADAMAAMDVQLNASTGTEATSLALIEGMSLGLPTVASSYGGTPYLIHHEVEGLLFTPGDANALASCLRRVMDDEELRTRLGQTACRVYEEKYTAEAFAGQLEQLYGCLLGGVNA